MHSRITRLFGTTLALSALLLLPACDRDNQDDGHGEMEMLQVLDRGQTSQPVVATWTHDGGWEGALPSVSLSSSSQRIVLGFRAYDEEGHEITLSETGDDSIRFGLAAGATQGIIRTDLEDIFHGDHVYIHGQAAGSTQIQFHLWHDDHADQSTTAISITVVN